MTLVEASEQTSGGQPLLSLRLLSSLLPKLGSELEDRVLRSALLACLDASGDTTRNAALLDAPWADLDGEIVALDHNGAPDFSSLQAALSVQLCRLRSAAAARLQT